MAATSLWGGGDRVGGGGDYLSYVGGVWVVSCPL